MKGVKEVSSKQKDKKEILTQRRQDAKGYGSKIQDAGFVLTEGDVHPNPRSRVEYRGRRRDAEGFMGGTKIRAKRK
jgi:hypothetical protein